LKDNPHIVFGLRTQLVMRYGVHGCEATCFNPCEQHKFCIPPQNFLWVFLSGHPAITVRTVSKGVVRLPDGADNDGVLVRIDDTVYVRHYSNAETFTNPQRTVVARVDRVLLVHYGDKWRVFVVTSHFEDTGTTIPDTEIKVLREKCCLPVCQGK
jgi:hypothetical protein